MTLIAYRKHITREITRELRAPEGAVELATVDGVTYVFLPDGAALGEQPLEIVDSIEEVVLDAVTRDAISEASPHVRLIRARVAERIAERYSITDEIKLLRTAPSAEFEAYNAYVEDVRAWGREQRAALGL